MGMQFLLPFLVNISTFACIGVQIELRLTLEGVFVVLRVTQHLCCAELQSLAEGWLSCLGVLLQMLERLHSSDCCVAQAFRAGRRM